MLFSEIRECFPFSPVSHALPVREFSMQYLFLAPMTLQ